VPIDFVEINHKNCPEIDILCINSNFSYIFVIYIPPNLAKSVHYSISEYLIDTIDELLLKHPSQHITMCGDFNDFPVKTIKQNYRLTNIVKSPTRYNAMLDYFFIESERSSKFNCVVNDPIGNSDHKTLFIKANKKLIQKTQKTVLDLRETNLYTFAYGVNEADWKDFYSTDNVDEKIKIFYDIINEQVVKIPKTKVKMKSNDSPWITPTLKSLICKRWRAYKQNNFPKYDHYKNKVTLEIAKCKKLWVSKTLDKTNNPWKIINNSSKNVDQLKKITDTFPNTLDAVNSINKNFHTIFTEPFQFPLITFPSEPDGVTFMQTEQFLSKIKMRKSYANDGIPPVLYHTASLALAKPLCEIVSSCLQKGYFPREWKKTEVIPVPKSKVISTSNLRPISLRSCLSLMLEQEMLERIKIYIDPLIEKNQFGFRKKSSTGMAIIKILNSTTIYTEQKDVSAVSVISFDLRKAFDTVSHEVLYNKLVPILPPRLLSLLCSYLQSRLQQTRINNIASTFLPVTSGVPQGGNISPILFTLFINDLQAAPSSEIVKFADDTTFIVPHYKNDNVDRTTSVIAHMQNWCHSNKIHLNLTKTQIITIKKSNISYSLSAPRHNFITILGVTITDTLKWNMHVDKIIKKTSSNLYLLRQAKKLLNKTNLIKIYYGLFDSVFNYCSPAFVGLNAHLSSRLQKQYNRAHRIICNGICHQNCIPHPTDRRIDASLKLLRQMLSPTHILHDLSPTILPRTKQLTIESSSTSRRAKQFVPYTSIVYNNDLKKKKST